MFKILTFCLVVLVISTCAYAGDTTNLQGSWLLDETSGIRYDETSNNNDLTDNNTVGYTTGQFGNTADFEFSNSEYLSITNGSQTGLDADGNTDVTVGAWIKLESSNGTQTVVGRDDGSTNRTWALYISYLPTQAVFLVCENASCSSYNFIVSTDSLSLATWYHIVGIHDAANDLLYLYKDGSSAATPVAHSAGIPDTTADFEISKSGGNQNYFDGLIDELFFFSRKLSASEITDIKDNGLEAYSTSSRSRVVIIQ